MKKIVSILTLCTITLTTLASCSSVSNEKVSTDALFKEPFSSTANITTEELEATGTIYRHGVGVWEIEFSAPETLSGVKLSFDGVNSEASYKGLSFSIPKDAVPISSMLLCLANAVDEVATYPDKECSINDGIISFKGSTDCGDYNLTVKEDTGELATFEVKSLGLLMTFSNTTTIADTTSIDTDTTEDTTSESSTETTTE